MCGRYTLYHTRAEIEDWFQVQLPPQYGPRYNIAPTQPVLVVRETPHQNDGQIEAAHVIWGLIPPWADDPKIGSRMINARCETAAEKPSFRHALKRRRCVLPASGFYEWERTPGGHKQPWLIKSSDHTPLALAGLWEIWNGPNGEMIESCTIITTSATSKLRHLHDRMPVLIPPDQIPAWLDRRNEDVDDLARYYTRSFDEKLILEEASREINSVRKYGELPLDF